MASNNSNTKHPQLQPAQKSRYAWSHTFQQLKWGWRRLSWPRLCSVRTRFWSPQFTITAKDTAEALDPQDETLDCFLAPASRPVCQFFTSEWQGFYRSSQPVLTLLLAQVGLLCVPSAALAQEDKFSVKRGWTMWPLGWQTHAGVAPGSAVAYAFTDVPSSNNIQSQQDFLSATKSNAKMSVSVMCSGRSSTSQGSVNLRWYTVKATVSLCWEQLLQLQTKAGHWPTEVIALLTLFLLLTGIGSPNWGHLARTFQAPQL